MKKAFVLSHIKAAAKAVAVLSLAVFQVSVFTQPDTIKSVDRKLAQSQEISEAGETFVIGDESTEAEIRQSDTADYSDEIVTGAEVEPDEEGNLVVTSDLLPESLQDPETKFKPAFKLYKEYLDQCLIKKADAEEIVKLNNAANEAQAEASRSKNAETMKEFRTAYLEFADKLVDLGVLENFRNSNSDTDSSSKLLTAQIGFGSEDETEEVKNENLLDKDIPEDFALIRECHTEKLATMDSEAREAYFEKHNVAPFVDSLREQINQSPEYLSRLANEFYLQAQAADAATENQYGFSFESQVHLKSAQQVYSAMAQIKALEQQILLNPADTQKIAELTALQTSVNEGLRQINTEVKAAAASAYAANPDPAVLQRVNEKIDTATRFWVSEQDSIKSNQAGAAWTTFSGAVTPTVAANPIPETLGSDNTVVAGPATPNIDSENAMVSQPNRPIQANGADVTVRRTGLAARLERMNMNRQGPMLEPESNAHLRPKRPFGNVVPN